MNAIYVFYFVLPIVLGVSILLAGGALLYYDDRRNRGASTEKMQGWSSTGGKVLATRLEERKADSGLVAYEPFVEYTYSVGGEEYHGSRLFQSHAASSLTRAEAEKTLEKYQPNAYIEVRYDPNEPGRSGLEDGSYARISRVRVAAQVLLAFGVLVCCFTSFMFFILAGGMSYTG